VAWLAILVLKQNALEIIQLLPAHLHISPL
jgi:hypothetical protein